MPLQQRNPFGVWILSMCTFGIYYLIYYYRTKNDLNEAGADIPTFWFIIIPLLNIYWMYKFCEGVETVIGDMEALILFLLHFTGFGIIFVQMQINKKATA